MRELKYTKEQIANVLYFHTNKTILKVRLERMNNRINSENNDYELQAARTLWIQDSYLVKDAYIFNVRNTMTEK